MVPPRRETCGLWQVPDYRPTSPTTQGRTLWKPGAIGHAVDHGGGACHHRQVDTLLPAILSLTVSLALTTAVAWPASRTVVRYTARLRPELGTSPTRLRARVTACCLLVHAAVLAALVLRQALDDGTPGVGARTGLALAASPVAVLVTLACACDVLCLRLPNLLLGLAAVPLVLCHLLRAWVMAAEVSDPCLWAADRQECQAVEAVHPADAPGYWPILAPLLVSAALTIALAVVSRLSHQIGPGDVKLLALLTFALAPFTAAGQVYALYLGLGAAGIAAGFRIALGRADRRTPIPLGPFLLGGYAVAWCLAL